MADLVVAQKRREEERVIVSWLENEVSSVIKDAAKAGKFYVNCFLLSTFYLDTTEAIRIYREVIPADYTVEINGDSDFGLLVIKWK